MEASSGQAHCYHSRLCVETPRAGGRVVEEGDVKLLRLASQLESAFLTTTPAMHLMQDIRGVSARRGHLHKI
jgi:hypothetical protein